jgi:hypothetical protein
MDTIFASRKNARRGAQRAGLADGTYEITERPDGSWMVCEHAESDKANIVQADTADISDDLNFDADETTGDEPNEAVSYFHEQSDAARENGDEEYAEEMENAASRHADDAPPAEIATSEIELVDVEIEAPTEIPSEGIEIVDEHMERAEEVRTLCETAIAEIENRDLDTALNTLRTAIAVRAGTPRPGVRDSGRTYKEMQQASGKRSSIANPVKVVFQFLDANQGLGRKQALDALVEMGVNWSTAHTQYQKWRRSRADGKR